MQTAQRNKQIGTGIIAASLWITLVSLGFGLLLHYEGTPGPTSAVRQSWPASSKLQLSQVTPYTLVMFLHPQCPCTSASISELAVLMAHSRQLTTYAVFIRPKGFAVGWERSALWQRASAIPGVHVVADIDGRESHNFAAATSGETALYDRSGKLAFTGGITGARGHEGDNQGLSTIEAIVGGAAVASAKTGVFGCALNDAPGQSNEAKRSCLR